MEVQEEAEAASAEAPAAEDSAEAALAAAPAEAEASEAVRAPAVSEVRVREASAVRITVRPIITAPISVGVGAGVVRAITAAEADVSAQ